VVAVDAFGSALERLGVGRYQLGSELLAGVDGEPDGLGADGCVDLHRAVSGKVVDDGVVQEVRGHLKQERV